MCQSHLVAEHQIPDIDNGPHHMFGASAGFAKRPGYNCKRCLCLFIGIGSRRRRAGDMDMVAHTNRAGIPENGFIRMAGADILPGHFMPVMLAVTERGSRGPQDPCSTAVKKFCTA